MEGDKERLGRRSSYTPANIMPRTDKDLKRQWFRRAYINGDVKRDLPRAKKADDELIETPREVIDIIPVKPVGRPHDVPNHNRYHSPPREGAEAFKKNTRVAWVDQYYVEEKPGQKPADGRRNWTAEGSPTRRVQSGRGYSAPGARPRRDSHIRKATPPRGRDTRGVSPNRRYPDKHGNRSRNTNYRREGPYSPKRFLYTPPGRTHGRSPQRARSSADIFQPRSRRQADGRNARTPSPRRVNGRDAYRTSPDGITRRLSPSLPYTSGRRAPQRGGGGRSHGRVSSAPKYGRSMSHPKAPIIRLTSRSADGARYSPVRIKPAAHGKTKRTAKQRAVKGGAKKTPHARPTPWRPVGDPTARQYRTRPDNYSSGTIISN
ncbi:hypothetical protein PRIPAC_71131 [Pristionchus pacificus]|uniref:Uncharacterized protein n=1 Tax=Pristionchus pacificus TaxID=54126 RepID=A0A454XX79_PRIPA|nr:hypothetical protein PRIPAC_71131 [Pristionchus pacificus]|eukprot:PDM64898.1 hypothetical protein PRIPAC_53154 [Pristionchus pacificus]